MAAVALAYAQSVDRTPAGATPRLASPRLFNVGAPIEARRIGAVGRVAAPQDTWGGSYAVEGGEVHVVVSRNYPEDPARARQWADFLSHLFHGAELYELTLYLAPDSEVGGLCNSVFALGCYASGSDEIFAIGDASAGVRPEAVVAHEYGHHIAAHRDNAPWDAAAWGTKRWASRMNICTRAVRGQVFPADDGTHYERDPGEAFAESYRVLNGQRVMPSGKDWPLVDESLYPDKTALRSLARDVVDPWSSPTSTRLSGRFTPGRSRFTYTVETPLDGTLEVALDAGAPVWVALGKRSRVVMVTRANPLRSTICGMRRLTLRVAAGASRGAFRLAVRRP